MTAPEFIFPGWPVSAGIRACVTTRHGGVSNAPFDGLNLGNHVGDDPQAVAHNRQLVRQALQLPAEPVWLQQTHSISTINADDRPSDCPADASWTDQPGVICAVMTADCLPVFFANQKQRRVAVAHAGWRGLADGILEATVDALDCPPNELTVWLGPAIGSSAFEVGDDVRDAFTGYNREATQAFKPKSSGKWLADLYLLACQRLNAAGIGAISGGEFCTYSDNERFFSYRRDGKTGRMASLIWLE